jgi:hypothetical protein
MSLGLGLAGTAEAVGATTYFQPIGDYFWTFPPPPVLSELGWVMTPEATVALTGDGTLDDVPDNPFWDLKDIGDGEGAYHFTPEDTSTIGEPLELALPTHTYFWLVGRAAGGDVTDTGYLRPIGLSDPR